RLRDTTRLPLFPYTTLFRSDSARSKTHPIHARAVAPVGPRTTRRRKGEAMKDWSWLLERAQKALAENRRRIEAGVGAPPVAAGGDRKSTRLNSSHGSISYAV